MPIRTRWRGLQLPDALVGVGDSGESTLVIANSGQESVVLEGGDIIGSLQQCEVMQLDGDGALRTLKRFVCLLFSHC